MRFPPPIVIGGWPCPPGRRPAAVAEYL